MILQAMDLGLRNILFSGGEPLLRNDLLELITFAKKNQLKVSLATNGTLVDDYFIKNYHKLIDSVNISLDAASASRHDAIRGVNGSFDKTLKSIEKIQKRFKVSLTFTAHAKNLTELNGVAIISRKMGVPLTIKRFIPVGEGIKQKDFILSNRSYGSLIKNVNILKKTTDIYLTDPMVSAASRGGEMYGGCLAGIYAIDVDFNGDMYPCTKMKVFLGNVRKESLLRVWEKSSILRDLRDRKLEGICRYCKYLFSCGGCRAAAYAKYNNFLAGDPLCFINK